MHMYVQGRYIYVERTLQISHLQLDTCDYTCIIKILTVKYTVIPLSYYKCQPVEMLTIACT